jgi:hypothetical protein
MTDARQLLQRLVGQPLSTITHGNRNEILRLEGDSVIVATDTSEDGNPISVRDVQEALDTLDSTGEVRLDKGYPGYRRAAFLGAVLRTLPDVEVQTRPRVIRRRRR